MADLSDEDMLAELGVEVAAKPERAHTAREERVIAGFEDILKFQKSHGRAPLHGEDRDIFERLFAVRLDRLRALTEFHALLAPLDAPGLLAGDFTTPPPADGAELAEDEDMLAELGVSTPAPESITELRHVRPYEEKRAAEEIANRTPCRDFARFKPLFAQVKTDLDTGARVTRPFVRDAGFLKADIKQGELFVLSGQIALVAEVGDSFRAPNGETDARLRVVYANGTESNLLLRSLQRALYKDEAGRRITEPTAGPLFANQAQDDDVESGTIYVLRSLSDHPDIASRRDLIHKIGVTGGDVATRIADAANQATYLLAAVEVAATYRLFNINRTKLEHLLHQIFEPARLELEIQDRFGKPVKPREWFLVPLSVIDEAVARIRDGTIVGMSYDPATASLRSRDT